LYSPSYLSPSPHLREERREEERRGVEEGEEGEEGSREGGRRGLIDERFGFQDYD
jgi:hypothetical protein